LGSSVAALRIQKVEQVHRATLVCVFTDVAVLLGYFEVARAIELDHMVVHPKSFEGIVYICQYLTVRGFLLLLRLGDGEAGASDFTLIAIEDGKRDASVEVGRVDAIDVGVVGLGGDVRLANRLLQFVLAVRGGHPLLRRVVVRPVLESFDLQIFEIALHRLIVEGPGYVIVGRNGFISEQLPQVRKALDASQLGLLNIGLELQQL
jgi:hypothetical protein